MKTTNLTILSPFLTVIPSYTFTIFLLPYKDLLYFFKIDHVKAYYQIPVHPGNIPQTTITTPFGLFEFTRMPFGLRNTAQTFQRFIDQVLQELKFTYAYIDDVLIASQSPEEHLQCLQTVFHQFQ